MQRERRTLWMMCLCLLLSGVGTASALDIAGWPEGKTSIRSGANLALNRPAKQSSRSQWSKPDDAQGVVDGVKNGSYGFHTAVETNPWWEVDLGRSYSVGEIRLFNRLDCCSERARTVQVLLSNDGERWRTIYRHNGSTFGGNDGKPLVVQAGGEQGRYVRLQLAENSYLHLDEVEIYEYDGGPRESKGSGGSGRLRFSEGNDDVGACVSELRPSMPSAIALLTEYRRQAEDAGADPVPLTERGVEAWLRDAAIIRCMRELGVDNEAR